MQQTILGFDVIWQDLRYGTGLNFYLDHVPLSTNAARLWIEMCTFSTNEGV